MTCEEIAQSTPLVEAVQKNRTEINAFVHPNAGLKAG